MSDTVDRDRSNSFTRALAQRLGAMVGEAVAMDENSSDCQHLQEDRQIKPRAQNSGGQLLSTAS